MEDNIILPMSKDVIKNLGLILLLSVAAFSMVKYASELKAKLQLQDSLKQAQSEVAALTQEKQNLLQEIRKEKEIRELLAVKNLNLKAYSRASANRLTRLFRDHSKTQKEFEEAKARFAVLKAENKALIDSYRRSYMENEEYKLKLSWMVELKKAIQELKTKKPQALDLDTDKNKGFLIKDHRSTSDKIKIEVTPSNN